MKKYNKANIPLAKELRKNMTPWERKLWYEFLRNYPLRFQRQKAIGNYIADFYCAKAELVVELDGSEHYSHEQIEKDKIRTETLESMGLRVLRFSNLDIDRHFHGVCEYIDSVVKKSLPQSASLTAPSSEGADTKTVFPDYYKDFRCIKGGCKHNCCIGWEIDVDPDTLEKYKNVGGEFGERLSKNISLDGEAHFVLAEKERCPFLNRDNLCDIIINLGEDYLCQICDAHPRFKNELPDRVEVGLGLCCEAAARLILSKKEPVKFLPEVDTDDEIILLRDGIISVLQDREISLEERIDGIFSLVGADKDGRSASEWAEVLLGLERLDENWTKLVLKLKDFGGDTAEFDRFMLSRQTEYEQFLVYLIYRHFANAPDFDSAVARARFAVLGYEILRSLGAIIFSEKGDFTLSDQIELARLFSSEIEYSDENLYTILDGLC